MAERDPIDVIREQLSRANELAGLTAEHELFTRWHGDTKTVLEKVFSAKSIHSQTFLALRFREVSAKAFASPEIDRINATRYKKDLETAKNLLLGAIKELTLDRTLFKKMQTTPITVEVSLKGEYFISPGLSDTEWVQAIERAFEETGSKPCASAEAINRRASLSDRLEQIKRTRFGIYDVSAPEREQVLLELGAALGLGREVVLVCKKGFSLPEVLRQLGHIEYEDFSDLGEKLKKTVKR